MQSKVFLFALTASLVSAAKFSNSDFTGIAAGTPFEITWIDASGPVTINLKSGPSSNLNDGATIGSGLTGSSFSWTPSASLSAGPYALEIVDSTGPNYSVQFLVSGSTSATGILSGTSAATLSATPSPSVTLSTSELSSSSTSASNPGETGTFATTTLSTARSAQTLDPTETVSDSSEETTVRRTTSTGTQFTRTSSSPSSSASTFGSSNSAAKDGDVVVAALFAIPGVMMLMDAVF